MLKMKNNATKLFLTKQKTKLIRSLSVIIKIQYIL